MKSDLFKNILYGMLATFAIAGLSITYWVLFTYTSCERLEW